MRLTYSFREAIIIILLRRTSFQAVEKGFKMGLFRGMLTKVFWVVGSFLCI